MAPKLVLAPRAEARKPDRTLPLARPVMAPKDGLTAVLMDLAPTGLAAHAVSVTSSHATDVPATPDQATNAATETDRPVLTLARLATPQPSVTAARRALAATVVFPAHVVELRSGTHRMTGTVGRVLHVTVPVVLRTPGEPRDLKVGNVRPDAPLARVPADGRRLDPTVVTHVMLVKLARTPTDAQALRHVGHEVDPVTGRALHRVGEEHHGRRANSLPKR